VSFDFYPQITQITQINNMDYKISRIAIGCAMIVHRELGCGFLESVYENALVLELQREGIKFKSQVPLLVHYRNELVGRYIADIIINDELLLELKALQSITGSCESQLLNYLKASGIPAGLILNFGSNSFEFKRMVFTQQNHQIRSA